MPPYKPEIKDDLKFFNQNLTSMQNVQESVIDRERQIYIMKNRDVFKQL